VLLFPTAGGDAEECERFHLVGACGELLEAGRVKIYSIDNVAGRAWLSGEPPRYCSFLQNRFDAFIYHELVPAIRADCQSPAIEVAAAGASIGAFNAVASLCRHPDVFRLAIGLSGTYDLTRWLQGEWNPDFYFSSPLHYLPDLQNGDQLALLRRRFALLATGEGRWEDPGQSWRMAQVLGAKGIPNRVEPWGTDYDHDWPTWRQMLPHYLAQLA
jgi:esterase/lipase superfamily enzyme